ncbi:TonB-dependent receptor [Sphingoaurantiacus capsulatus]|uniref:TonB-dependent receptor n=1 Tax=Sphingoaurantiacus capsulatus TaxID=1771310 RepID=A0ABV7X7Z1_9SPHN
MRRLTIATLMLTCAEAALAQRADDNATTKAEDAFGTSVGNESFGLYNPFSVRGFSPVDAGNVRMEGLYFDQQASPTGRLIGGTTVRVGLSAQNYPFPAPTGIADHSLRKAGSDASFSPVVGLGPYGGWFAEFDAQLPVSDTLSIAGGSGFYRDQTHFGGDPHFFSMSVAPRWQPAEGIEVIPYWSRVRYSSEESEPLMFTGGDYLPPKISRKNFYPQDWTTRTGTNFNYGILGQAPLGDWTLRGGVFRSVNDREKGFANLFTGIQPDGAAQETVVAQRDGKFASTSGEVRLSRSFDEGDRRHSVHLAVRGREQTRRYGGDDVINLGPTVIGVRDPVAKPVFNFGAQSHDRIEQKTGGISYELRWRDIGEFSAGIQKTDYSKSTDTPTGALPTSKDSPWLYNATAAGYLSDSLVVYGGYTRGLEESPRAPDIAVNRNDAPPAIRTEQVDAGIRWAIRPNLRMVAGVFDVSKPFYDLDQANIFTRQGTVRHRGLELSIAGQILPGLTMVAGNVLLDAEVTGEQVDLGLIGPEPVATTKRYTIASLDYRFPNSPFSIDAFAESTGDRVANQANTFVVPPRAVLALGGRYRFKLGDKSATLRAQVGNVFNNYGFGVGGGGLFVYNLPRRFTINLAADL